MAREIIYSIKGPKTVYEMTWTEVEELRKKTDIILIPVGAVENHGPHLPLGTDSMIGDETCRRAALALKKDGIEVAIAPTIPFGISMHHMCFPGTIDVRSEVLTGLVMDVCTSMIKHGFKKLIVVPSHFNNIEPCEVAVREIARQNPNVKTVVITWLRLAYSHPRARNLLKSERPYLGGEGHAGEKETSCMLTLHPSLVRKEKMVTYFSKEFEKKWKDRGGVGWANCQQKDVTPYGHIGDPTKATAEEGEAWFEVYSDPLIKFVKEVAAEPS